MRTRLITSSIDRSTPGQSPFTNDIRKGISMSEQLRKEKEQLFLNAPPLHQAQIKVKKPKHKYGEKPRCIGIFKLACPEMLFYQYLPIKLIDRSSIVMEQRLAFALELINAAREDFAKNIGDDTRYYIYITAKSMYQFPSNTFNRPGYHSDGFLTDDINYIWSDCCPTVFNCTDFKLSPDDVISLKEMEEQADPELDFSYKNYSLLRLTQYNIHRVAQIKRPCYRNFVKISFSKDKYDLEGNSINHLLSYDWKYTMRKRTMERNIPQQLNQGVKL